MRTISITFELVKMMILLIFIFGLIIGSFLNVCIYRMPLEKSVVRPGSHCTSCGKNIYWFDNIPLLSFLLLGGKCRFCKAKISSLYPTVEFLTALVSCILFIYFRSMPVKFVVYAILTYALITVTFIDIKYQIIPDSISVGGSIAGLILSFALPSLHDTSLHFKSLFLSAVGMLLGGGSIYAIGVIGKMVFKKEAMGGGDVKLMAMVGSIIGWKLALFTFFIAPFFGSVVGIYLKLRYKTELIPYGPYLSLATLVSILWGNEILKFFLIGL